MTRAAKSTNPRMLTEGELDNVAGGRDLQDFINVCIGSMAANKALDIWDHLRAQYHFPPPY
jgi:hypothetical protein